MSACCVVIVDPVSTGANVAMEAAKRGHKIIAVWCTECTEAVRSLIPACAKDFNFYAHVSEQPTLEETSRAVKAACGDMKLLAVIVGAESGVTLADNLSENLALRTNGTALGARRNKSVQQKLVKASGLRAVREACGTEWSEVATFCKNEPMPVVVKPVESAGSDGVKLCHTFEEAETHFTLLMGAQQKVGSQGAAVLCQEFLKGKEYVIDSVSLDGVHKTMVVWVYDKRAVNGSSFVYFGMLPVEADSEEGRIVVPYMRGVLDALGIKNGATHGEVMMTEDGPCLVEVNCRAHGGDGYWIPLARALTGGYSQVDVAVDACLSDHDKEMRHKFHALPSVPSTYQAFGQEVLMVSYREGTVIGTPGYDKIRALESCLALETNVEIGERLDRTVDLFTQVGSVIMCNTDVTRLAKDVEFVRQMELEGTMFQLASPTGLGMGMGMCGDRWELSKDKVTVLKTLGYPELEDDRLSLACCVGGGSQR